MKITVDVDEVLEAVQEDRNAGFCIVCGEEHYGVEPEVRRFQWDKGCGPTGYGAEELLMRLA